MAAHVSININAFGKCAIYCDINKFVLQYVTISGATIEIYEKSFLSQISKYRDLAIYSILSNQN